MCRAPQSGGRGVLQGAFSTLSTNSMLPFIARVSGVAMSNEPFSRAWWDQRRLSENAEVSLSETVITHVDRTISDRQSPFQRQNA
ncbi:hypothetical protein LSAT2_006715 [Lamellibrachia satsuma]|nr:hypothetical protein LSAT2_006715 [Lamellibrachia satsuma]